MKVFSFLVAFLYSIVVFSTLSVTSSQEQEWLHELKGQGGEFRNLSESEVYQRAFESYKRKNRNSLESSVAFLRSSFPDSAWGDNGLYLLAMHYAETSSYAQSIEAIKLLEENYPTSNRRASALILKGVLYREMGYPNLARSIFERVKRRFPRSPQAYRAEIEVKNLTLTGSL